MVTNCGVNFILDNKMLRYFHVFMLSTYKAYNSQQYMCVFQAILGANGQTWHEYALTAVNSPRQLKKGHRNSPNFKARVFGSVVKHWTADLGIASSTEVTKRRYKLVLPRKNAPVYQCFTVGRLKNRVCRVWWALQFLAI